MSERIDPVAQATTPCSKCGMTAWKREFRTTNWSTTKFHHQDGTVTESHSPPWEYLKWTCWTCGYGFDTPTVENYQLLELQEDADRV